MDTAIPTFAAILVMASSYYFTIAIKLGSDFKLQQKLIKVSSKDTILEIIRNASELVQSKDDLQEVYVNETSVLDQLDTTFDIISSLDLGTHIVCHLKASESGEDLPAKNVTNAFDVLRQAHRALDYLPPTRQENNQKDRLHNDVIKFLGQQKIGFPRSNTSLATFVVQELRDIFWYLDPLLPTLAERYCHVPKELRFEGYVNYRVQKKKKPTLIYRDLKYNVEKLQKIVMLPWLSQFNTFKEQLFQLCDRLEKTCRQMKNQQETSMRNHASEEPIRSMKSAWDIKTLPIGTSPLEVQGIKNELDQASAYEIIGLHNFLPTDSGSTRKFIDSLQFPFEVRLFTYSFGNYLGNIFFVWRAEAIKDDTKEMSAVKFILDDLPKFSTRAMRHVFLDRYNQVSKPHVLRDMYRFLTSDDRAPETQAQEAVDLRVFEYFGGTDDSALVMDLRTNNKNTSTRFDVFWDILQKILDNKSVVDERRSTETMYMPDFLSVRDLREEVLKQCPPNTDAPSEAWLRFQFQPTNPYVHTAAKYTSRFTIKYKVQQRLLRHTHPDAKYCAMLYRYIKSFCVKFREVTHMICVDDKAIIPVGGPDLPVSTNVRRHGSSIVVNDSPLYASDHDYHLAGIVPSVVLNVEIPENRDDSFHRGVLHVTLKDKVFSPSTPIRHACETTKILREATALHGGITGSEDADDVDATTDVDFVCPILVVYSDGGPDHNTTFMAVKLAALSMFVSLGLDFYVAARCAPMQSFSNPAERCMSVLNIALQSCALAREKMSDYEGIEMKRHSSLSSLRSAAAKCSDLKMKFKASMEAPIDVLVQRFSRLKYAGHNVRPKVEATEDEIELMKLNLSIFVDDEEVDLEKMKKKPKSYPKLSDFMEKHVRQRQYCLQVKKCLDVTCWYCSFLCPIRMDEEDFKQVNWIPDPMPSGQESWKSFDEVYGTETTDAERPSLKHKPVSQEDVENKALFVAGRVRGFISCAECGKRRCVYSATTFNKVTWRAYKRVKDDHLYTCGDKLFHQGEDLEKKVVVRQALTCTSLIEALYYSARATSDTPICCLCGKVEDLLDGTIHQGLRDLQSQYATVRPICMQCWESGKRPQTRNQVKTSKK